MWPFEAVHRSFKNILSAIVLVFFVKNFYLDIVFWIVFMSLLSSNIFVNYSIIGWKAPSFSKRDGTNFLEFPRIRLSPFQQIILNCLLSILIKIISLIDFDFSVAHSFKTLIRFKNNEFYFEKIKSVSIPIAHAMASMFPINVTLAAYDNVELLLQY